MKHLSSIFLQGKRLYLRACEAADIPRIHRWRNDPEIRAFTSNVFPRSEADQQARLEERRLGTSRSPQDIQFAIVLRKNRRHIGVMGLHAINWVDRNAITGAMIGEKDCWNKGYGGEAKELVLAYAFDTLGLHRVSSDVLATNPRSLAYLQKSGYRIEGRKREHVFRDGEWVDLIDLGILASEWRKKHRKALHLSFFGGLVVSMDFGP